jgi:phosphohistidine phosphatase SixA
MRSLRRWFVLTCVCSAGLWFAVPRETATGGGLAELGATIAGDLNGDGRRDISDALRLLGFLFAGGPEPVPCATVQESFEPVTILLLRHAEKGFGIDPELTEIGRQRAARLAEVVGGSAYDLLLSSNLTRTVQTLGPLAELLGQEIEGIQAIAEVVARLDALAHGEKAVVVHHSFTIRGILDGLGVSSEDLATVRISGNDDLWIVTRAPGRPVTLTSLRYATDLNDPPLALEDENADG